MKKLISVLAIVFFISCKKDKKSEDNPALQELKDTIQYVDDEKSNSPVAPNAAIEIDASQFSEEVEFSKARIHKYVAGNPQLFNVKDTANLRYLFSLNPMMKEKEVYVELGYLTNKGFDTIKTLRLLEGNNKIWTYNYKTMAPYEWPKKGMSIENGVDVLKKLKADTKQKLETATPKQANELYKEYLRKTSKLIDQIAMYESEFLDDYYSFYSYDESKGEGSDAWMLTLPKAEKAKKEMLNTNQIEIWDIGEGMHTLRLYHDAAQKMFSGKVTPDYQDYIDFTTKEEATLYQADAAIVIEFSELGDRIIYWKNFIEKYPNSDLLKLKEASYSLFPVIEHYKLLQRDYLLGAENTPTLSYPDAEIYDESKNEFLRFKKKYPNSYTAKLIDILLENKENDFQKISKKIQKAINKNPLLK